MPEVQRFVRYGASPRGLQALLLASKVVALRAGINRVTNSERYGLDLTPSVGAGFRLKQVAVDYGFGDFGGLASELGFSHRISVQLSLEQPSLKRKEN